MNTLTRKQREIREREQKILSVARPLLLAEGYHALSMDRIAEVMEYAKGTIYNHFPNKEEIVIALALESMEIRRRLFERASMVSSQSRQRMTAVGCACDVYSLECREHFAIEQLLRNSVIWEKSSEKRQELIKACELRTMGIVAGIVRDAVAVKDLALPTGMTCEEFVFGFWALTYGSQVLVSTSPSLPDIGVNDPIRSMRYHCHMLMDGYQWQPLLPFDDWETYRNSILDDIRCGTTDGH